MIDILSAYGKEVPSNSPVKLHGGSTEGLVLQVSDVLDVHKRTHPTDDAQNIYVSKEGKLIIMETEKQNVTLTFSIDELRAIMRLFDVSEDEE